MAADIDHHVCLHRFDQRSDDLVYPIRLPQPLPRIAVPQLPDDPDRRVRYDQARIVPPLAAIWDEWLNGVLSGARP